MNPGSCSAWEMGLKRLIHVVLDWLHLKGGSARQIGRVKEWVGVGCGEQIAEWTLETDDDVNLKKKKLIVVVG